ncbi:MAG: hypothetical protein MZV64_18215 [Ignavibacteriales bacterium]|nr:hypothetical protein [Ignavibacteriales bacterium]
MEFAFGEKHGRARPRPRGRRSPAGAARPTAGPCPSTSARSSPRSSDASSRSSLDFAAGPRPRGLRARDATGPAPPSRPPRGQADGRAHGRPGDGRPARTSTWPPWPAASLEAAPELQELQPTSPTAAAPTCVEHEAVTARRRGAVHRGEAGRADLPRLPAELLPDQHGRRPSSSTGAIGEEAVLTGPDQPRPRPLLRQRGHRALARGRGGDGDGRRQPRPPTSPTAVENALVNRDRERRVRARHGRGPGSSEPLREPADVVIVDPPRVGLTNKALAPDPPDLGAPSVVYVSCNPESLARDLRAFREAGYRVASLRPFDLFPHTPHLETLAVLSR